MLDFKDLLNETKVNLKNIQRIVSKKNKPNNNIDIQSRIDAIRNLEPEEFDANSIEDIEDTDEAFEQIQDQLDSKDAFKDWEDVLSFYKAHKNKIESTTSDDTDVEQEKESPTKKTEPEKKNTTSDNTTSTKKAEPEKKNTASDNAAQTKKPLKFPEVERTDNIKRDYDNCIKYGPYKAVMEYTDKNTINTPLQIKEGNQKKELEKIKDIYNKIKSNKDPETDEVFSDWDNVKEIWLKIKDVKRDSEVESTEISTYDGDKRQALLRTLWVNRNAIKSINDNDSTFILKKLKKIDNGDHKVDENEFKSLVKELQENDNIKENAPIIFYLIYLHQSLLNTDKSTDDNTRIINKSNSKINKNGLPIYLYNHLPKYMNDFFIYPKNWSPKKLNSGDTQEMESTELIKTIDTVFETCGSYSFNPKILNYFSTLEKAKKAFENVEFDKDLFYNKTQEEKKAEELDSEIEKQEENIRKANNDYVAAKQKQEEEKEAKKEPNEEIMTKKKFYIFDIQAPNVTTASQDDFDDFFQKMTDRDFEGGAFGLLQKQVKTIEKYKPTSKFGKGDLKLESIFVRCMNRNNLLKEDFEKRIKDRYNSNFAKLDNEVKTTEGIIQDLTNEYNRKISSTLAKVEATDKFDKKTKLRMKAKTDLINYGAEVSKIVKKFLDDTNHLIEPVRKNSTTQQIANRKTKDVLGQEEVTVRKINQVLSKKHNKDAMNIARYMVINLLQLEDSEEIIDFLKQKNFNAMGNYICVGRNGMVTSLDANSVSVETINNFKAYKFDAGKTAVYKNPESLLTTIGIRIGDLSVDVLKRVKKEIPEDVKKEAADYMEAAKKLTDMITKLSPNASVFTEGVLDKIEQMKKDGKIPTNPTNTATANPTTNPANNQSTEKPLNADFGEWIKNVSYSVNNFDEHLYQPQGNGPEDIALRQIFKTLCYISNGKEKYITTILKFSEVREVEGLRGDASNKQKPEEMTSSVVTSSNADSTYGNGFNAKELKKKLNSTTYTYSPTSKMKIVRRTFD